MPVALEIEKFLSEGNKHLIIDVRTPAEFEQGHIPGAYNIPLFTNEERAIVGTLYKQTGRQEAIFKGLEIFGPRMTEFIERLKEISKLHQEKNENYAISENVVCVHCWRGGMRSGAVAWLFEIYGYRVFTLKKGYKAFRRYVLDEFEKDRKILVLGGRTGSAKTLILHELKKHIPVIDLEGLAHHKGSSFGSIGELPQPTQEQFENNLALELLPFDRTKNILVEDESRKIGHRIVPGKIFEYMRNTTVFYCDVPFETRAAYLASTYGKYPKEDLIAATERILKRLDTRVAKDAIRFLEEGSYIDSFRISLKYYDKTYDYGLSKREGNTIIKIPFETIDAVKMSEEIIRRFNQL